MRPSIAANTLPIRALLALMLCAVCTGAWARSSDRQQPMDVQADHSDTSLSDNGVSTLTGNVVITQGTMIINSDKAVITKKAGDISLAVLTGGPVSLKQNDENGEQMTATAREVDYDLTKDTAVFTGNAVIDQPTRGQMHGERIVYNIKSGQVTSGGDGTRVSMHILPKQANAAKPAADGKATDKPASKKKKKKSVTPAATPAAPAPDTDTPPGKTP
jgi:lipopolysaccharide export system protein LptA